MQHAAGMWLDSALTHSCLEMQRLRDNAARYWDHRLLLGRLSRWQPEFGSSTRNNIRLRQVVDGSELDGHLKMAMDAT